MSKRPRDNTTLRAEAETLLAHAHLPEVPASSEEVLLHELQVHQIELEMQNEELRRMQVILEESRDRYVDLYELAPVGYVTLNVSGMITEINLAGAALLGEQRQQLVNRRFSRFVCPADGDRWHRIFSSVLQHGEKEGAELTMQRADGSRFDVQLEGKRSITTGETGYVRIILTDITERRQAELEQRVAAIAFQSQEAIMVTDASGVILRVNDAFTRLTGFGAEEVVGKTPALLKSGLQDDNFYRDMWAAMRQKRYWQGEMWNKRKDGNIYPEWQTISAVLTPDGSISHYISTFIDITERKKLERKNIEQREQMAELHRAHVAAQTAAAIAHELNQPLLAIASYSGAASIMLQAETPNLDKIRHAVEESEMQAQRAGKSIREMLEFLSLKEFSVEPLDLNMEIRDVMDTTRSEFELKFRSRLELETDLAEVRCNRMHLHKVLLNLLHNGIEAMHGAGVPLPEITVTVRTAETGGFAQVTIQDSGPGIKNEDVQQLFQPFFTTKDKGMGMGLAISRSLIEMNGGQLWVEPTSGAGATFHFTLPFAT